MERGAWYLRGEKNTIELQFRSSGHDVCDMMPCPASQLAAIISNFYIPLLKRGEQLMA
jgi:hypothetical protein